MGMYLEGFVEQITGLLLSIEARKKNKQHVVGDQKKLVISRQKGQRELKNLRSCLNAEYGSSTRRSASSERAIMVHQ